MAVAYAHESTHEQATRPAMNQLGLWLFFISESFLFAALATSRYYIAGLDQPEHLNQALGLGITSILLMSSFTAYRAEAAMAHGYRGEFQRYLFLTILFGVLFAGGVAYEWATAEFSAQEPYGTAFFTMTGLHASHVLSGIGLLSLVLYLSMKGHFTRDRHWGVEASIKYWHFVDVVWVFFYPTLYLVSW